MIFRLGNVLDADFDVLAHGCNLSGGFNKGIAKEIAKRYPDVKQNYMDWYGSRFLGELDLVEISQPRERPRFIANLYTQLRYGKTGRFVSYTALGKALSRLNDLACFRHIHMPLIGYGYGGGDLQTLLAVYEDAAPNANVWCTNTTDLNDVREICQYNLKIPFTLGANYDLPTSKH